MSWKQTDASGAVVGYARNAPPSPTNGTWTETTDSDPAVVAFLAAPPTIISAAEFLARFASTEQAAIQAAAGTNTQIGLGLTMILAAGVVDVTSASTTQWMATVVSSGLLTQARSTQILNLGVASP